MDFKVRSFPYSLKPQRAVGAMTSGEPRPGALLEFTFNSGRVGYADCYPWPELGDAPLAFQISELECGRLTPLTRQSLWHAERDARFRAEGLWLTDNVVLKSHFLIEDIQLFSHTELIQKIAKGFHAFKVKVGKAPEKEILHLRRIFSGLEVPIQLRLDFNSRSNPREFAQFISSLGSELRSLIEFVEDPFSFDWKTWAEASRLAPLALDLEEANVRWELAPEALPFQYFILKPARQDVEKALDLCQKHKLRCVVTSSLDHPLGRFHAAQVAVEVGSIHNTVSGLGYPEVPLSTNQVLLNPRLSLGEQEILQALAKEFPQRDGVWIASSGSSQVQGSSLKLVALSKKALEASARAVNRHLQVTPLDTWAQVLPKFHVGGLGIHIRADLMPNRVVDALKDGKWDPSHFTSVCEEEKITLTSLVPTQVYDLVEGGFPVPSALRAILVGGAAISPELYLKSREKGWPLLPSYGMTEMGSTVAAACLESLENKTQVPAMQILDHVQVQLNPEGRIQISGESLMAGSAQSINGKLVWSEGTEVLTEDLGEISEGALQILGRANEFVKILGEGVNLAKLRLYLQTIQPTGVEILEMPHPRRGMELILVVEEQISSDLQEQIFHSFNQSVAPYEELQRLVRIEKIPRTDLGKVKRAELAQRF